MSRRSRISRKKSDRTVKSKRFRVTLPWAWATLLEKLAETVNTTPDSRAAYIVQRELEEGVKSGLYPSPWSKPTPAAAPPGIDKTKADVLAHCMKKLKKHAHLSRTEVCLLESILNLDPGELTYLTLNELDSDDSQP